jgi:phosphopantetheine--protein transferase-like protein
MTSSGSKLPLDTCAHIWYRQTDCLSRDAVKMADIYLSGDERIRRDRLHFEADRRDFTIAHDLLRRALSSYRSVAPDAWQFSSDSYGKPSIDSADPELTALSFSLTHTRGCVACAIAVRAPVGVDVERIDRSVQIEELADRYFDATEAAWLRQCCAPERAVRFIELWTLKEAFLKARGLGLNGLLASVSFQFEGERIVNVSGGVDRPNWHFAVFEPVESVRLAVALRGARRPRFCVCEDGAIDTLLLPPLLSS